MPEPTPEEVLRQVLTMGVWTDKAPGESRRSAFAALDQLLQERDDRAAERDLAWEARDGWRAASDEKLAENARLRAELDKARAEREALLSWCDVNPEWYARAAAEMLRDGTFASDAALSHQGEHTDRCPTCGSDDIRTWPAAHPVEEGP